MSLFGQIVEVEDLAALVFEHDLRMQIALVLLHHAANVTAVVLELVNLLLRMKNPEAIVSPAMRNAHHPGHHLLGDLDWYHDTSHS